MFNVVVRSGIHSLGGGLLACQNALRKMRSWLRVKVVENFILGLLGFVYDFRIRLPINYGIARVGRHFLRVKC
jgi:hypothetical protein